MSGGRAGSSHEGGIRSWVNSMAAVWNNIGRASAVRPTGKDVPKDYDVSSGYSCSFEVFLLLVQVLWQLRCLWHAPIFMRSSSRCLCPWLIHCTTVALMVMQQQGRLVQPAMTYAAAAASSLQNPTQNVMIDPVRGVTKSDSPTPGHKVQMRTADQVR